MIGRSRLSAEGGAEGDTGGDRRLPQAGISGLAPLAEMHRLVHSADFKRLLATPTCSRSAHFAVHHVASVPSAAARPRRGPEGHELSTDDEPCCHQPVDELPTRRWAGSLIPKRHARRSVTRNLLKRQVRVAMHRHAQALAPGLWLVRLRAPFSPLQFPSAASDALRAAARGELEHLLRRAAG